MTPGIQELMRAVERVHDAYVRDALAGSVDAALAGLDERAQVVHLPLGTGGHGHADLRRYLADDVAGHVPDDLVTRRISRTVDRFRVVEEQVVAFTHAREIPWLLPGAAPTGRHAEALAVSITTIRHTRITTRRTLWDLDSLLSQLGIEKPQVRAPGAGQVTNGADAAASWW